MIEVQQVLDPITNPNVGLIKGDSAEHLDIHFTVSGTYESLKLFLTDLGRSLRIVDITDLSFSAQDLDLYEFSINLRNSALDTQHSPDARGELTTCRIFLKNPGL